MQPRDRKIANNQTAETVVNTTESGTIGTIFAMLKGWVFESWHYGLFPLAGALSIIRMVLVIRQAKLEQGKNKETIATAVMESLGAAAINTAVVFSFVGAAVTSAAVLAVAAPIMFTATLGAKSLYSLGVACYYLVNAVAEKDADQKNQYFQKAGENFIGFIAGSLVTVAIGLALIAAHPLWSLLGMAGAAIGLGFGGYTLFKAYQDRKTLKAVDHAPAPSVTATPKADSERSPSAKLTNGAVMHKALTQSQPAAVQAQRPAVTKATVATTRAASPVPIPTQKPQQAAVLPSISELDELTTLPNGQLFIPQPSRFVFSS